MNNALALAFPSARPRIMGAPITGPWHKVAKKVPLYTEGGKAEKLYRIVSGQIVLKAIVGEDAEICILIDTEETLGEETLHGESWDYTAWAYGGAAEVEELPRTLENEDRVLRGARARHKRLAELIRAGPVENRARTILRRHPEIITEPGSERSNATIIARLVFSSRERISSVLPTILREPEIVKLRLEYQMRRERALRAALHT